MQHLERTLLEVRQRLHDTPEDGFLVCYRPMAERSQAHVEAVIERMSAEIVVIAQEFALHPSVEDIGSHIVGQMAVAWSDLNDTLSPKLERYGPVDPSLAETLDPHIRVLIELAQEMGQAASGNPPEEKDSL